jgi:L-lactate dehydrogenase complex protein LldF
MTTKQPSRYVQKSVEAISSPELQQSLASFQNRLGKGAMDLWKNLPDPAMRQRVKQTRMRNLENLHVILAQLADRIRDRGGHVYFAQTAEDAVNYTVEVARKHKVKRIVKGKSMTSMEIKVDPALEAAGIEVVETDLGEYIIQLAGDQPSHIIAPCIHMNRNDIGELFADKLKMAFSNDPPTLTMAARTALREKFLTADMGITGCNLACAATGHISLVSNEGNIRMATTVPPVNVAIMGMERVSASLAEHGETMQLLSRGGACQKISTYVSFLGGPAAKGDPDGPNEFHLIILDNGRSRILGDPDFREVLACIRCGACLNICPVYGKIGGHAYGSTCSGPIGAVITPLLHGINKYADLCKGETLCGACKDICPVENDLPRMLSVLRHKLAYGSEYWQTRQHKPTEAFAFRIWRLLVTHPRLYRTALGIGRFVQKMFPRENGMIQSLGPAAKGWTTARDLQPLAPSTFSKRYHSRTLNDKTTTVE